MRVSFLIPCIPSDLDSLYILLDHVSNGTRHPDEIIIVLSEAEKLDCEMVRKRLFDLAHSLNLSLNIMFRNGIAFAGDNRNFAAVQSTGDILLFHDADDDIHPKKIEIIESCFAQHSNIMLISHLLQPYGYEWQEYKDFKTIPFLDTVHISKTNYNNWGEEGGIQRGHPAVRREVFEKVQFDITKRVGEDLDFLQKVLREFNASIILQAFLCKYDYIKNIIPQALKLAPTWIKKSETNGLIGPRKKLGWDQIK